MTYTACKNQHPLPHSRTHILPSTSFYFMLRVNISIKPIVGPEKTKSEAFKNHRLGYVQLTFPCYGYYF